jgi:protein gp37
MSANTKIEWTDMTWNPLRGCSRVSEGCRNCYAERVAMRFRGPEQPYEGLVRMTTQGPKWTGDVRLVPEALHEPFGWAKPRRVFVNSMSDLFHESVPFEFIASVFAVMSVTSRHTYQVLTKRPARMVEFFEWVKDGAGVFDDDRISHALPKDIPWVPYRENERHGGYDNCGPGFPYENVWLGVSVEDQKAADERIPLLLKVPTAVRWISAEPLLGPIDLGPFFWRDMNDNIVSQAHRSPTIDWVVVGGESGHGARPMHPDWARSLRDQCERAGVKFLFKQHGEWMPAKHEGDKVSLTFASADATGPKQPDWFEWPDGQISAKVGKKAAGRLLDGVEHNGFPESV